MRWLQVLVGLVLSCGVVQGQAKFASHPPTRPLPVPTQRALGDGPTFFVDAAKGDDAADGSRERPWKTVARGAAKLKAGETLCLRGGTYYEHVTVTAAGTAEKPITLRAFPGELVVLDGGLREFFETPDRAWEPCPGGAKGEFRSVKAYPTLGGDATHTNVLGNFGDSMVPLHGYRFLGDLRSDNVYWNLKTNVGDESHIYCGPGLFYDVGTGRIHARLAPTNMKYLPAEDNYQGETDPRKVPLVVAGHQGGSPLTLRGARHVRVLDLVVRGSRGPTVEIEACTNIELDGLTVYGGSSCFQVRDTAGLRVLNTACRGIAAPWTFRGSLKYRAIESRLFSAGGWTPTWPGNRKFELAYCEFTDSVDGVFVGNVAGVRFHHNLLDNVTDDGLFLTAGTAYDGTTPGGDVQVYQNRLSRCLTTFAFGVGHGRQKAVPGGLQTGSGVLVFRNVFDYRRPLLYHQPRGPEQPQEVKSKGRVASDHGGPAWEPMTIYHNTILADDPATYAYGTAGLGDHVNHGTRRRVFNNVVVQMDGLPGRFFPPPAVDFQADGNLHWSAGKGATFSGDPFAKFRTSKAFVESKARYAPGWGAGDRFADPLFAEFGRDWKAATDLRLRPGSPAIDMGVSLPADWPDPWRQADQGKPDAGAVPLGADVWHVGVRGRLTAFGDDVPPKERPVPPGFAPSPDPPAPRGKPAAIIEGYPAFDAPLLEFALRRQGAPVDVHERAWLDTRRYADYGVVALVGNLPRAKIAPGVYSADDLPRVHDFMTGGGTLVLMTSAKDVFRTPEGQKYFAGLTGTGPKSKDVSVEVREPSHPWLSHLKERPAWLKAHPEHVLRAERGERILATRDGASVLYRVRVGKGQLVYVGWEIAASLPASRAGVPSLAAERDYEEQFRVLLNVTRELYP